MEPSLLSLLSIINSYPPKALLNLDIAHILTLRRLHHEATELLSNVLALDPLNPNARILRMQNFMALGNYAGDAETADLLFERGVREGEFILSNGLACALFYAEYSLIHWSRAIKHIKSLRRGVFTGDLEKRRGEVFTDISLAEHYAKTAMTLSQSGVDNRCFFWLLNYNAFRQLLEKEPGLLSDEKKPLIDQHGIYPFSTIALFSAKGWLISGPDGDDPIDEAFFELRLMRAINTYMNSISSTSHFAKVAFAVGTLLWDFATPEKKIQVLDRILLFLEIARKKAEELKKLSLGVYACTEIQSPAEFIHAVNRAKRTVEVIRETGDFGTGIKLSLLGFDDDIKAEPITFDLIRREEEMG